MSGRKKDYGRNINAQIDKFYELQFGARIVVGAIVGVGAVVGALAGLGLSFTALSPLVIGGVVGATFPALLALVAVGLRCYYRNEINEAKSRAGVVEKHVIAALMPFFISMTASSVITGVSLAAAANAALPGAFATWWSVATGAGIGAIALPAGIITGAIITAMFAGSLLEHIVPDQYVIGPRVTGGYSPYQPDY